LKLDLALALLATGGAHEAGQLLDALPANLATDARAVRLRSQLDLARALKGAPSLQELQQRVQEVMAAARDRAEIDQTTSTFRAGVPQFYLNIDREKAEKDATGTNEFISFLQKFLLAFAGIALFVGSFVIANTLSITIAQRTREFATIRTIRSTAGRQVEVITVGIAKAASSASAGWIDISRATVTARRRIHPHVENTDMYM